MRTNPVTPASRLFMILALLTLLGFASPAAAVDLTKSSPASPQPNKTVLSPFVIPELPASENSPKVDGVCDKAEYSSGVSATFTDGPNGTGTGTVFMAHDDTNLYVCISSPLGSNQARFDSLYLDPTGDGANFAQPDDHALRLNFSSGKSSFIGNGLAGGWQDVSGTDNALWNGSASTGSVDVAEYSLPLIKFNLKVCSTFRLAAYHHWFAATSNDYGWPTAQYYDQPGTWQPVRLGASACDQSGKIAYVYRDNNADATSFYNLLASAGYSVTLVTLGEVTSTDFSSFDLTVIANDTGTLNEWGNLPAATGDAQVAKIMAPNRPILGLGEGGYSFFGRLSMFIGWPMGWHGPQDSLTRAVGYPPALFSGLGADPVQHYSTSTNSVGIYMNPSSTLPADVTPAALEYPADDHASLIQQDCKVLWGNSGSPAGMTSPDGTRLFLNTVLFARSLVCATPPDPASCSYSVVKSANPDTSSPLPPGTAITYTLTYSLASSVSCPMSTGKLVDVVPAGTLFVAGSASDGISPGADGVLTWAVSAPAASLTKHFKVLVMDTACTGNDIITNTAELRPSGVVPLESNSVTHSITCPPISLPNTQPMYAEDELTVAPYPLVTGVYTHLSVRIQNLTSSSVPVTVQFQVAPGATPMGVDLDYTTVATSSATLPGSGTAILEASFVPDSTGNRCFQALVSSPGMATPLATQSCLDLNEDFQPGHLEQPVFVLKNNTGSSQDYLLVVDNTCPGWTASVDPATITGLAAGASRDFTLSVTPPNPLTLGSGCHIDVQVWRGGELVGGIRKLDLPPVHLPTHINPSWEEPEITFNPDPPVAGVPGQVCIQIQNPLSHSKVATINFSVADFGAGIAFVPAASLVDETILPGVHTYCAPWTPAVSGTLHRCVLATLVQAGALDQNSQHNVDIVHPNTNDLGTVSIPFIAGNPGLATRTLSFAINTVGIVPPWVASIVTPIGNPPPASLPGGGQVDLVVAFGPEYGKYAGSGSHVQRFGLGSANPFGLAPQLPLNFGFGSRSSVEVTLLLDGSPAGGFSVDLERIFSFLPLIQR
jgi:hypothetical protein